VVGYGRNLALPLLNVVDAGGLVVKLSTTNFQQMAMSPQFGDTLPHFNPWIKGYRHLDILRMIVFYNQTFDIHAQDDLLERINKFRRFLAEY
jgi:hypothetical protein